jgi:hypothetical protein
MHNCQHINALSAVYVAVQCACTITHVLTAYLLFADVDRCYNRYKESEIAEDISSSANIDTTSQLSNTEATAVSVSLVLCLHTFISLALGFIVPHVQAPQDATSSQ